MPYDLMMFIMLRWSFSDMFLCLPSNILYRNIEVWSSPQQSRPSIFDRQRKEESSQFLKSIPNSKFSSEIQFHISEPFPRSCSCFTTLVIRQDFLCSIGILHLPVFGYIRCASDSKMLVVSLHYTSVEILLTLQGVSH